MAAEAESDPVELVRAAFAEACEGLEQNATVTRARTAVDQALATVNQWARLIVEIERPRQQAVAKARAEREAVARATAEREAAAKAERVQSRRALQNTLRGAKSK